MGLPRTLKTWSGWVFKVVFFFFNSVPILPEMPPREDMCCETTGEHPVPPHRTPEARGAEAFPVGGRGHG